MPSWSFLFVCLFLFWGEARAGILLDLDATMFQNSVTTTASQSQNKTFYGGGLYLDFGTKQRYYFGALMASGGATDKDLSSTTTFTHQDVMLALKWFIDRDRLFSVTAAYGVLATATYDLSSAATEKWRGSSYFGKFTVAPEIGRWNLGISLLYYQGSYNERTVSQTTTSASRSATMMWPALSLAFAW